MTAARRRLALVLFMMTGLAVAVVLALAAFERNLLFFFTPTQVANGEVPAQVEFRIGGIVTPGSVQRQASELAVSFVITDGAHGIQVRYAGLLPDLFREGKGIVVRGVLTPSGSIEANEVLAKHDENYLPPEVIFALEKGQSNP